MFVEWNNAMRQLPYSCWNVAGIALLRMKKSPVNSLNQAMLADLNIALEKLENDKKCRGLIITSVSIVLFHV